MECHSAKIPAPILSLNGTIIIIIISVALPPNAGHDLLILKVF